MHTALQFLAMGENGHILVFTLMAVEITVYRDIYTSIDLKIAYGYLPRVLAIQCVPLGKFDVFFGNKVLSLYLVFAIISAVISYISSNL